jgi:hypothetical protein
VGRSRIYLLLIFFLGLTLRITGLGWGLPSDTDRRMPFHPDEVWAFETMQQMNWGKGDFNPEPAHREGTLAYTIWAASGELLKRAGVISDMPWTLQQYDSRYGRFLLMMRAVNALADAGGILLIYFCVISLTADTWAALLAAWLFAVTPFELIYAHYARTHTLSNFFALLVCAVGVTLLKQATSVRIALAGFLSGAAAATRYPAGGIVFVPALYLLASAFSADSSSGTWWTRKNFYAVFRRESLLGICALAGFVCCDPLLFWDFQAALPHLKVQAGYVAAQQFEGSALYDFSRLGTYLLYLVPYGLLPCLWLVYYGASIWICLRPRLYRTALPLLAVVLLSLVVMGKGYLSQAQFIRAMYGAFPLWAFISGLAAADIRKILGNRPLLRKSAAVILFLLSAPSVLFDWAYVHAMCGLDPRTALAQYLDRNESRAVIHVGIPPSFFDFPVRPGLQGIRPTVLLETRDDFAEQPGDIDYVILIPYEPQQFAVAEQQLKHFQSGGKFRLVGDFRSAPSLFGHEFDNSRYPHDLQYPFPRFLLLQRVVDEE